MEGSQSVVSKNVDIGALLHQVAHHLHVAVPGRVVQGGCLQCYSGAIWGENHKKRESFEVYIREDSYQGGTTFHKNVIKVQIQVLQTQVAKIK